MALKLNETYPGRFNNPSSDYPQGSFKNRTSPTAQDGSYFEQQWANDQLAFFSSLLSSAGVTANGLVDKVGASQYYSALLSVISTQAAIPSYLLTSGVVGTASELKITTSGTSASVVVSAASICVKNSSNNQQAVLNSVLVSPNLVSSGAGGLDTGTSAANTWYSVWVIWNGTMTAGLLSLSPNSPTMPSGYTHKARVGWVRTDGTANKYPLPIIQVGKKARYTPYVGTNMTALRQMASGVAGNVSTPTYVAVAWAQFVPQTASHIAVVAGTGGTSGSAIIAPNTNYLAATSSNPAPISLSVGTGSVVSGELPIESANIHWASSTSTATLNCFGWEDNL